MSLKAAAYKKLPTEQPNPATRDIDLAPVPVIVRKINEEDKRVAAAVGREGARIARAVDAVVGSLASGGRLFFVGAGTSGRLGVLEAAECPPTFSTPPSLVQGIIAGGRGSMFRAKEGAEDDARDGARQLRRRVRRGDVVMGVAASGVTPFVGGALRAAKALGCRTVLVTSNRKPGMRAAEIVIGPDVGPEVLSGSTRLKAGTAAKLVLNTVTTASFIRLGKVYDHWMVDLKPTNRKLRLRAVRMLGVLTGLGPPAARALLVRSGDNVKTAVLSARLGLPPAQAAARLRRHAGSLRRALSDTGGGR